jgi:hypothetical protein
MMYRVHSFDDVRKTELQFHIEKEVVTVMLRNTAGGHTDQYIEFKISPDNIFELLEVVEDICECYQYLPELKS